MIKPLYFPNIHVDEDVIEILEGQFDNICVYGVATRFLHADTQSPGKKTYETITPAYDDDDQFNEFLLSCSSTKPFYESDRAYQITAELQDRIDDDRPCDDPVISENERLMRARLFLKMAHEYDIQSRAIHRDLSDCKKREQELLNKLQGFEKGDHIGPESLNREKDKSLSDYRIEKRFESWTVLFEKAFKEQGKSGNGFYITDIRAVIETIVEFESDLEFVCEMPCRGLDNGSLSAYVEQLVDCDWNSEKNSFENVDSHVKRIGQPVISIYILPEKHPFELFRKFLPGKGKDETVNGHLKSFRNTVLGYIEI